MKFSVENKIIIGFSIAIIILLGLGYYSYIHNKSFFHTSKRVSHTHKVLYHSEQILTLCLDIETGQRGYVLTGDEKFLEPHKKAISHIEQHIQMLKDLTSENPHQQRRIKHIAYIIKKKIEFATRSVDLRRKEGINASQKIITSLEGKYLMDQIRALVSSMQQEENILLNRRIHQNEEDSKKFNATFLALVATTLFIISAVAILMLKSFRSLQKASLEVHDLYNNAPCGYHSLNNQGVIVEINQTELDWLGYRKEEVVHKLKFADVITSESRSTLEKNFENFKKHGKVKDLEFDLVCKSGSILPVVVNSSALYTKDGKYLKSRSTLFDNTAHKISNAKISQLNQELEKNLSQLQVVNSELESFTYSVSHDLRAPLRSVAGYAQILQEDYENKLDEEGKKTIYTIVSNAKKMGQLIDDLLAFSRYGKIELIKTEITMDKLVHSMVDEIKLLYSTIPSEVTIKTIIPSPVDISMIKQVWFNLISNAFKYSGSKNKSFIEIGSYAMGNENIYYVKDNGVGFNMEYAHKLFGVFQRLHKMKEFEGTGVGLAIVKRIIVRHGGRVWAEGEVNKGATFYFSIPQISNQPTA